MPLGQIRPCGGGGSIVSMHRLSLVSINLLWEKNSKIFFSETTGHTALIFCMWQWLMVLYINCASHAPGVKFGHAPGVDSLHRLTMGKTKIKFFSETKKAQSFYILYVAMFGIPHYKLCQSCPWVKFGHAPGVNSVHA